jgi:radical SAM superfamily enzyme YgiQ (UPF0313 family)
MKTYYLTLIYPKIKKNRWNLDIFGFHSLGLKILAQKTPRNFKVNIVSMCSEKEKIPKSDLIGITVYTTFANLAYKIADKYRKKGTPVILGGYHVSTLPDEALKHADSVVIGEADDIWKTVIEDFKKGKLKKKYYASLPDLKEESKPFQFSTTANQIQTTRGCPSCCDFCTVHLFNGRKQRHRSVNAIVNEIKQFKGIFKKLVVFTDDNIVGDKKYAKELFKALIPLKIKWYALSSINIAEDLELLDLAYKSGCRVLQVGLESISQKSLKGIKKANLVKRYSLLIKRIKKYNIILIATFILGLDNDEKDIFNETVKFCKKNDIDLPCVNLLAPYPGTNYYKKLDLEKRVISKDWNLYDSNHVVYTPKNMSQKELLEGFIKCHRSLYSIKEVIRRTGRMLFKIKLRYWFLLLVANWTTAGLYRKK